MQKTITMMVGVQYSDVPRRIERVFIPQGTTDYFLRFDALKQYRHRLIEL